MAVGTQPAVELDQGLPTCFSAGPTEGQHGLSSAAGLLGRAMLPCNQAVRMRRQEIELAGNDGLLQTARLLQSPAKGGYAFLEHFQVTVDVLLGDEIAVGGQGHRLT